MPYKTRGPKKSNSAKNRKLEEIAKTEKYESYGFVTKSLGNKRFRVEVNSTEGHRKTMVCALKGSCRKFVNVESYVLVVLYDFNEEQGQIVDVYTDAEVQALKKANLWDFDATQEEEQKTPDAVESLPTSDVDDDDIDNI